MVLPYIIGGVVGLYGAHKQSQSAKKAQQANNDAADAQYRYNVQRWEMDKQKMLADRDYKVREIEERARQEGQLAAFKDATNARQYNYQLQIRNSQQDTNERMFAKSNKIFTDQLGLNALQERNARQEERQQLSEIQAEKRYEQNSAYIDGILAEGEIRARGQTAASQNAIRNITTDRTVADLNAYASKMLDPGVLPMPLQPLATPQATFMYPRVYQDYDFGPEPIQGAMISPSSAAAQVWGSSLVSLAGTASNIIKGMNN